MDQKARARMDESAVNILRIEGSITANTILNGFSLEVNYKNC